MPQHVSFEEGPSRIPNSTKEETGLTAWLIARGIASDKKNANTILLFLALVFTTCAVVLFVLSSFGSTDITPLLPPSTT